MLDDLTRCADGPGECPRADQCARTLPSNRGYMLYVYFWLSAVDNQKCLNFVRREALEGKQ